MTEAKIILENDLDTIVYEFKRQNKSTNLVSSESESALEERFIDKLKAQGYEYLKIHNFDDLEKNLKVQLEKLNNYKFSEDEWENIKNDYLFRKQDKLINKTERVQKNHIYDLVTDAGSIKNIKIIDKQNWSNNTVQVINQFKTNNLVNRNRYDVTILINGLPLVHIELKRRGVSLKEAFNQISRYKDESFSSDNKIFDYVQIFVISNGTQTKYYANTTRLDAYKTKISDDSTLRKQKNFFQFTSFWTDLQNNHIEDLMDFSETFFRKKTLLNIITKYCIFNSQEQLLVMRPYQIAATEKIIQRVNYAINNPSEFGHSKSGGFIWHTTGSGKTLTSFKTATLLRNLDEIDKVLFVVDRRDLDYQTMTEYEKFEKGSAASNLTTNILANQLKNNEDKIIITTINKLSNFCSMEKNSEVFNKKVVMIFDECHRSQFGKFHKNITSKFKKYLIFGFTGTPIFVENAQTYIKSLKNQGLKVQSEISKTTSEVFGPELHKYTIIDAIRDENVLKFKMNTLNTFSHKENIKDKMVSSIDANSVFVDPKRIKQISEYILANYNRLTKREVHKTGFYEVFNNDNLCYGKTSEITKPEAKHIKGFNSILATRNIESAKKYYEAFKKLQEHKNAEDKLKIALIYSYDANQEGRYEDSDENYDSIDKLQKTDKEFLSFAINDYNEMFKTNWDVNKFLEYYKDVSKKVKNREIDILIVVNMFLTGFDAKVLNTLWIDKELRYHNLLQAFSRTNRISNEIKDAGNIVCFVNLDKYFEEALKLFGSENASKFILYRSFNDYYNGYTEEGKHFEGWKSLIQKLQKIKLSDFQRMSKQDKTNFVKLFNQILRLRNILFSFEEFENKTIISEREFGDYKSHYNDIYEKEKANRNNQKEIINEDLEFEISLAKANEYDVDDIVNLIVMNKKIEKGELVKEIEAKLNSNIGLRSKKELIIKFVIENNFVNWSDREIAEAFSVNLHQNYKEDLNIICNKFELLEETANEYLHHCFIDNRISKEGLGFFNLVNEVLRKKFPSLRDTKAANDREKLRNNIYENLKEIYYKYSNDDQEQ
ncbi:type I restriction endonuclease subunit R [Mycoplasma enhydrae]|uniref:type I restriction endonuclease subunit R n=1 Tax=Mycoplasma enhydrae TaxID=2499220 RepID=UPI0021E8FFF1|nr:type I restriction endonuclease subunit R [Mycoplasma enhydrae]MCV3733841.1 type I restriction endonuclease subunit R [Mycoplasma enhydrae]